MTPIYAWQLPDWPQFFYDAAHLEALEQQFLLRAGMTLGIQRGLTDTQQAEVKFSFLSAEALETSRIEGEILDRDSLQSSIQSYFEFKQPLSKNHPRENGIARMMVDLYLNFDIPLSADTLFEWHQMLMNGRTDLNAIGRYRFHSEPMQIVSRIGDNPCIHYIAPPSADVPSEMARYIKWFNTSRDRLPPLVRAGIAHLYFELIHPFEDGNGRLGRALIEKALAESLRQPTLIAVSQTIRNNQNAYYDALEAANKQSEITEWLVYFGRTILDAQQYTIDSIEFILTKTRFFDTYGAQLNTRQHKLIERIFQEKLKGFTGGVSVKNYRTITKISPATANRDLNDLVQKGIMTRTGKNKSTRYWISLQQQK